MARRVKRELDDFNANIESVRKIEFKKKSSLFIIAIVDGIIKNSSKRRSKKTYMNLRDIVLVRNWQIKYKI